MKKCILMLLVGFIFITGCTARGVNKKQVKDDLMVKFAENNFLIEDIEINLQRKDKKQNIIELTATMMSDSAKITRMYRLVYDYYEVGGWVLESCEDIHTEKWKAVPNSSDITKESISKVLFYDLDEGDFIISNTIIHNAKFEDWINGTASKQPAANCISKIETVQSDLENGETTVIAYCNARSSVLNIWENFKLRCKFNPKTLCWDIISGESVDHGYTILANVTGTYMGTGWPIQDKRVTISKDGEKLIVSGCYPYENNFVFSNEEIEISGLFKLWATAYDADRTYTRGSYLAFYPDRKELVFQGSHYETQQYKFIKE